MKHFKPYVNLIRYKETGQYQLNAVINLPSDYSVVDQKQEKIDNHWVVTLLVKKLENMRGVDKADKVDEFSFKLESPDIKEMDKIRLSVKDSDGSSLKGNDEEDGTDIDPSDAEDDDAP